MIGTLWNEEFAFPRWLINFRGFLTYDPNTENTPCNILVCNNL